MLTRDEVRAAIRFQDPPRPPRAFTKWWGEGLGEQYGEELHRFDKYEEDVVVVGFPQPWMSPRPDGFWWHVPQIDRRFTSYDSNAFLPDWEYLPDLLAELPNTDAPGLFDEAKRIAEQAHAEGKYVLIHHWSLMYELIWQFRGMQELLIDYYEYPEEVHALHRAVLDTEIKLLKRAFEEVKPDGYMISDDLGTQTALMMSPAMFREFIKPAYEKIYGYYKTHGVELIVHHSDSYAATLVPDMIDMGIDIWQGVMTSNNIPELIKQYGGKISFMGGVDSATIDYPGWTVADVEREVDRACRECGKHYFIPGASQGLAVSTFPGVYEETDRQIDLATARYFK